MRTRTLAPLLSLGLILCAAPLSGQAGSPNTTPTTVTRIVLVKIKPGHAEPFWADVRQHSKPINDEYKRQGIITNYSVATKSTSESADDWNVVFAITYKNWAALDDLGPRIGPITLAHYGSAAQRTAAFNARLEHSTLVASFLVRDQTVNPWR